MTRVRILFVAAACLVWLTGCSSTQLGGLFPSKTPGDTSADPVTTGSIVEGAPGLAASAAPGLDGSDPYDDLTLGKRHFRAGNYGLAESHFRKAVESHPRDAEAWVGLAAAYDRLRRFDLADRAYGEALKMLGPTPEVLNNQGYSYMLRGDYRRARAKLLEARAADPANPYVAANLALLDKSAVKKKAVR